MFPINKMSILTALLAIAPLTTWAKTHRYSLETEFYEGMYFASPNKKAPGVVLIPNWMGVSPEAEKQARRFQKLGYHVFVADVYGAGTRPKDSQEAGVLAGKYKSERKLLRSRVHLAIQELSKQHGVDTDRLAVLGYCFGGTSALEAARAGEKIRAAISFHGGLDSPTPGDGANIKAKVLALHGAIDPFVPAKDVSAFENEMQTHKVDYELIKYGGAVHSFTDEGAGNDPSKGAAYNAVADERSFARAKAFLADALK
ncbi:MAG: dienelactone hydrolase family protein [Bdellovibrionales bacterium]|nr:dienelactone hydrolase family protein [Bdellovibrionales bacterium]